MRTALRRIHPIFARLALILLLQCPLPVLHAHGATASELSSIPSLPEHLRRCHRPDERLDSGGATFGWHLHVLPPLGTPDGEGGDGEDRPDIELPWRSDESSGSEESQLRIAVDFAAEPAGVSILPTFVAAPATIPAVAGDAVARGQRRAILRA